MMFILLYALFFQFVFVYQPSYAVKRKSDRIIFPGQTMHPLLQSADQTDNDLQDRARIIAAINQIQSVQEFNKYFREHGVYKDDQNITSRNAIFTSEISKNQPEAANCEPMLDAIIISRHEIPNLPTDVYYWPMGVKLKRCKGPCLTSSQGCTAGSTINRMVEIRLYRIIDRAAEYDQETRVIELEEHEDCECACHPDTRHCTDRQKYDEHLCDCYCPASDEKSKCNGFNLGWNTTVCKCQCLRELPCPIEEDFDEDTCSCKLPPPRRSWVSDVRTSNYNPTSRRTTERPIIYPLNTNNPRRRPKEDPEY